MTRIKINGERVDSGASSSFYVTNAQELLASPTTDVTILDSTLNPGGFFTNKRTSKKIIPLDFVVRGENSYEKERAIYDLRERTEGRADSTLQIGEYIELSSYGANSSTFNPSAGDVSLTDYPWYNGSRSLRFYTSGNNLFTRQSGSFLPSVESLSGTNGYCKFFLFDSGTLSGNMTLGVYFDSGAATSTASITDQVRGDANRWKAIKFSDWDTSGTVSGQINYWQITFEAIGGALSGVIDSVAIQDTYMPKLYDGIFGKLSTTEQHHTITRNELSTIFEVPTGYGELLGASKQTSGLTLTSTQINLLSGHSPVDAVKVTGQISLTKTSDPASGDLAAISVSNNFGDSVQITGTSNQDFSGVINFDSENGNVTRNGSVIASTGNVRNIIKKDAAYSIVQTISGEITEEYSNWNTGPQSTSEAFGFTIPFIAPRASSGATGLTYVDLSLARTGLKVRAKIVSGTGTTATVANGESSEVTLGSTGGTDRFFFSDSPVMTSGSLYSVVVSGVVTGGTGTTIFSTLTDDNSLSSGAGESHRSINRTAFGTTIQFPLSKDVVTRIYYKNGSDTAEFDLEGSFKSLI